MSVMMTADNSASSAPKTAAEKSLTEFQQSCIRHFRESMEDMAMALGDLSRPMRRSLHNRERLSVEDAYACIWQSQKQGLCAGNEEASKQILREQGCSAPFMRAVYEIMSTDVGYNARSREDQAQRFSVALRLAVHLSPDKGAAIFEQLDYELHPDRRPHPLAIVNAYLALKAREFSRNS
jgi:hypothetical protein